MLAYRSVPKMEGLWGMGFPLHQPYPYSFYKWIPPFQVPQMFGDGMSTGLFHSLPTIYQIPWTFQYAQDLGVSKNRGTPKWMVYNGKPY